MILYECLSNHYFLIHENQYIAKISKVVCQFNPESDLLATPNFNLRTCISVFNLASQTIL